MKSNAKKSKKNLGTIFYDPKARILRVRFVNGWICEYEHVSVRVFNRLRRARFLGGLRMKLYIENLGGKD